MLTMGSPNQWAGDKGAGGSKSVLAWESEYAESDELADLSASCHKSSPTVRKAVSRERGGSPKPGGRTTELLGEFRRTCATVCRSLSTVSLIWPWPLSKTMQRQCSDAIPKTGKLLHGPAQICAGF
jgi:hypothetical protein